MPVISGAWFQKVAQGLRRHSILCQWSESEKRAVFAQTRFLRHRSFFFRFEILDDQNAVKLCRRDFRTGWLKCSSSVTPSLPHQQPTRFDKNLTRLFQAC